MSIFLQILYYLQKTDQLLDSILNNIHIIYGKHIQKYIQSDQVRSKYIIVFSLKAFQSKHLLQSKLKYKQTKTLMGWFFNRQNNSNSSQHAENTTGQPFFTSHSSSSFYSKKRSCQNDPQDPQYLICKTVIKDNQGTREEEERIPKQKYQSSPSFLDEQSNFQARENFGPALGNFANFFTQTGFFGSHSGNFGSRRSNSLRGQTQNYPQNYQKQSYYSNYSQSRSCRSDPQNPEYLICKTRYHDGNQTKQVQEKVKASEQNILGFHFPSFSHQIGSIGKDFGGEIDKELSNLIGDINNGFNFMMPFLGPMIGLANAMNPQNYKRKMQEHGYYDSPGCYNRGHSRQKDENSSHIYFSNSTDKDTSVHDL